MLCITSQILGHHQQKLSSLALSGTDIWDAVCRTTERDVEARLVATHLGWMRRLPPPLVLGLSYLQWSLFSLLGGASCWSSGRSQLSTQTGPAGEGAAITCPGTVAGRREGRIESEHLLRWLGAAPLAWIQLLEWDMGWSSQHAQKM